MKTAVKHRPLPTPATRIEIMLVTPTVAAEWLRDRNKNNRNMKWRHVRLLAQAITEGKWLLIPHPIMFDKNKWLLDGQHRLQAVVEANADAWMYIAYNVPRLASRVIDQDLKTRCARDIATFMGEAMTTREHACLTAMLDHKWQAGLTAQDRYDLWKRHREAIGWASGLFKGMPKKDGVSVAAIHAVVARACYTGDRDRIAKFVELLRTGEVTTPADNAALILRNRCRKGEFAGKTQKRRELYQCTEFALDHFLRHQAIKYVSPCPMELFLLPEEQA
jgi:hypothetical protein